jgi:ATP-binding cassette subfamily B multidrug efflux pump
MLDRNLTLPEERAQDTQGVVRRLWGYMAPEWRVLLVVLFCMILNGASQGLAPTLIGQAVDQFITQGDRAGLAQTMGWLFLTYVLGLIGFVGQSRLMGEVSQRVLRRLRLEIFEHIQRLSLRFFDQREAGDLMSRLVNDTEVIGSLFSGALVQALGALFSVAGIVIAMFVLNVPLALVSFIMIPVMFSLTQIFSRRARSVYRETRQTIGDVSSDLQEDIASVREAQAFNRTQQNIERFQQSNAANRDANVRAGGVTAAFAPAIDVLSTIATAIVAGVGGYLAFNSLVSVGVVVSFLTFVDRFFRPIQQISSLYTQIQSSFAASERVFELLDTAPDMMDSPTASVMPPIKGLVRFEGVSFGYNDSTKTIDNLTFEVHPGETVAIVGPTGAGKTTLVNLVPRFYDVNSGRITIDGQDIREVTRHSLRSQIGVVPQDAFLFAISLADNIRYGHPDAPMEEVIAAAKAARAHDFIMALPDGYETLLGERGRTLSQGQRQLLGIARALLAKPKLLILDEATASVDTRTERLIQSALESLLEGRTAFVIAHRLSTIRTADLILVMDQGRIVERGTHDELLAQGGLYADLYRKQLRAVA